MIPVTFICTSCGRKDLLRRTMNSFHLLNSYPITEYLINDDALSMDIANEFSTANTLVYLTNKQGQARALDHLMRMVQTEYVFTCEDDWLFDGNKNLIADSLAIMEADIKVNHVWCRDKFDHSHPLKSPVKIAGVPCQEVMKGYQEHWGGFSHNPGLKRMSDYYKMFPKGYAQFADEMDCSKHANKFNYKAVSLVASACKHIGWNRHTPGFKA